MKNYPADKELNLPSVCFSLLSKCGSCFQGVWKIPIDEIDRAGSFPSHLNKCIELLLEILKQEKDPATLFQMHLQLNRQPEAGK